MSLGNVYISCFILLKGYASTTCVGSNHDAGGTTRMEYEDCNTEPCPVWANWVRLSGVQCSADCGGGTIEERLFCVLADGNQVTTCDG